MYILLTFISYSINQNKTQELKTFPSDKINATIMHLFFFREFQLISFIFISQFLFELKQMICLKLCVGFSIFNSAPFSFIGSLYLSCNKKFKNSMTSAWVGAPQNLTWRRTLTFLYLIAYLFLLLIYFFNWIEEHPLKTLIKRAGVNLK